MDNTFEALLQNNHELRTKVETLTTEVSYLQDHSDEVYERNESLINDLKRERDDLYSRIHTLEHRYDELKREQPNAMSSKWFFDSMKRVLTPTFGELVNGVNRIELIKFHRKVTGSYNLKDSVEACNEFLEGMKKVYTEEYPKLVDILGDDSQPKE